jgi:hypothetical protein
MMITRRSATLAILLGLAGASMLPPARGAAFANPLQSIPITAKQVTGGATFSGLLNITSFAVNQAGNLVAIGNISGTLKDAAGNVIGTVTNVATTVPLTVTNATCQILSLHVGAINLNLLGLNVALAPIDLNITAQSGPGNLLGNLLCAVAHLLDNTTASLQAIVAHLNSILTALGV